MSRLFLFSSNFSGKFSSSEGLRGGPCTHFTIFQSLFCGFPAIWLLFSLAVDFDKTFGVAMPGYPSPRNGFPFQVFLLTLSSSRTLHKAAILKSECITHTLRPLFFRQYGLFCDFAVVPISGIGFNISSIPVLFYSFIVSNLPFPHPNF